VAIINHRQDGVFPLEQFNERCPRSRGVSRSLCFCSLRSSRQSGTGCDHHSPEEEPRSHRRAEEDADGQRGTDGDEIGKLHFTLKKLPLGTKVRLVNPDSGKSAEEVVNDRGPYIKGRDVDVSYAMAKQLGFIKKGVTKLFIETI
jgi:hypothetical protein